MMQMMVIQFQYQVIIVEKALIVMAKTFYYLLIDYNRQSYKMAIRVFIVTMHSNKTCYYVLHCFTIAKAVVRFS